MHPIQRLLLSIVVAATAFTFGFIVGDEVRAPKLPARDRSTILHHATPGASTAPTVPNANPRVIEDRDVGHTDIGDTFEVPAHLQIFLRLDSVSEYGELDDGMVQALKISPAEGRLIETTVEKIADRIKSLESTTAALEASPNNTLASIRVPALPEELSSELERSFRDSIHMSLSEDVKAALSISSAEATYMDKALDKVFVRLENEARLLIEEVSTEEADATAFRIPASLDGRAAALRTELRDAATRVLGQGRGEMLMARLNIEFRMNALTRGLGTLESHIKFIPLPNGDFRIKEKLFDPKTGARRGGGMLHAAELPAYLSGLLATVPAEASTK